MAKKTTRDELEELRRKVQELAAAQQASSGAADPESPESGSADEEPGNLASKFEELFKNLEQDINQTPTTTCLAIFALGILVGRALAA